MGASGGTPPNEGSPPASGRRPKVSASKAGAKASQGTFADAATFGEVLFNCTSGTASLTFGAGAPTIAGLATFGGSGTVAFGTGKVTMSAGLDVEGATREHVELSGAFVGERVAARMALREEHDAGDRHRPVHEVFRERRRPDHG